MRWHHHTVTLRTPALGLVVRWNMVSAQLGRRVYTLTWW